MTFALAVVFACILAVSLAGFSSSARAAIYQADLWKIMPSPAAPDGAVEFMVDHESSYVSSPSSEGVRVTGSIVSTVGDEQTYRVTVFNQTPVVLDDAVFVFFSDMRVVFRKFTFRLNDSIGNPPALARLELNGDNHEYAAFPLGDIRPGESGSAEVVIFRGFEDQTPFDGEFIAGSNASVFLVVPEPSGLMLVGGAGMALLWRRRRTRTM
jgi:hypothetical protein